MTEIERLINNGMALRNINDSDTLRKNEDRCH